MIQDKIENFHSSIMQHGKLNDRVYIMYLHPADTDTMIDKSLVLAKENAYSKIFAKVRESVSNQFTSNGFSIEAVIPKYYENEACHFVSLYTDRNRSQIPESVEARISDVLATVKRKKKLAQQPPVAAGKVIRKLKQTDCRLLAELYRRTFESYPFPIYDAEFLKSSMIDHTVYFGYFDNSRLVGASSAEIDLHASSAEMTDFAVDPEMRGNNISVFLLEHMEKFLITQQISVAYTICRSISYGMNSTFKKLGYSFAGTLINNTNISGGTESMNVWYKTLQKK